MAWGAIISGGLQIAGGLAARQSAKRAARANARLMRLENTEQLRRMQREWDLDQAEAEAAIGASGLHRSGSIRRVMESREKEYQRQRDFAIDAGEQRINMAAKGYGDAGFGSMLSGVGNIAGGLISAFGEAQQGGTQ